jgi:hypothetical protein
MPVKVDFSRSMRIGICTAFGLLQQNDINRETGRPNVARWQAGTPMMRVDGMRWGSSTHQKVSIDDIITYSQSLKRAAFPRALWNSLFSARQNTTYTKYTCCLYNLYSAEGPAPLCFPLAGRKFDNGRVIKPPCLRPVSATRVGGAALFYWVQVRAGTQKARRDSEMSS